MSESHSFHRPTGSFFTVDNYYRLKGNRLFNLKHYKSAIKCYKKAIKKNSLVPIYYTNRALCYLKLKQWKKARKDCWRALNINATSIKAFAFLGITSIELKLYSEAVTQLQRAYYLAKDNQLSYIDIKKQLNRAHILKLEQQQQQLTRKIEAVKLLSYLTKLMNDDMAKKIDDIRISSNDTGKYLDSVMIIKKQHEQYSTELNKLFADNNDRQINGKFDPVSCQPLTVNQLIPNLALKEAVDAFLKDTGFVTSYNL